MSVRALSYAGIVAVACAVGSSAGQAFSVGDKQSEQPTFNLDEQTKNFRTGSVSAAPAAPKYEFETFLGKGTFELGAQQGPSYFNSPLGPGFGPGPLGPPPRNTRQDFNRMIVPDSLR